MRTTFIALLCFCFSSPLAARSLKGPKARSRVTLLKVNAIGVEGKELQALRSGIRKALDRLERFRWVPAKRVKARIKRARLLGAPLEKQVKASGVDLVITATVGGLGDAMSLDLRVFDGRRGKILRRAAAEVPLKGAGQMAALEELLVQLLQPERWVGSLDLKVSAAGARVMLDGLQVATTPLSKPLAGLVPGKHILMVSKEGFRDLSRFIEIKYNRVFRLDVDLNNSTVQGQLYEQRESSRPKPKPKPAPILPVVVQEKSALGKWQNISGFVCLGLGAATAVGGALLVWHASDIERQLGDSRPSIEDQAELESLYNEGRKSNRWGNGLMIGGAALSMVSAGFFIWAWLDQDPTGKPAEAEGMSVSAAPLPDGLGFSFSSRF